MIYKYSSLTCLKNNGNERKGDFVYVLTINIRHLLLTHFLGRGSLLSELHFETTWECVSVVRVAKRKWAWQGLLRWFPLWIADTGLHPAIWVPLLKTKLALDCALLYVVLDSICLGFPHALPNWFPDHDLVVQHFPFPPPVSCFTFHRQDSFFLFYVNPTVVM